MRGNGTLQQNIEKHKKLSKKRAKSLLEIVHTFAFLAALFQKTLAKAKKPTTPPTVLRICCLQLSRTLSLLADAFVMLKMWRSTSFECPLSEPSLQREMVFGEKVCG